MALKRRLTAAEFEKITDESIRKEYKKSGDEFILDIEGDEDIGALKRAKDREAAKRREVEEKYDALQEEHEELKNSNKDGARRLNDVKKLQKEWETEKAEIETKYKNDIEKRDEFIKKTLIDGAAMQIATKISNAPSLLVPHIKARLIADLDGDEPATKVLGKDGKPSAMSLDDLTKEIREDKAYAPLVIATRATGSGAPGGSRPLPGSAPGFGGNDDGSKAPDLSKLPASDLAARIKARKENAAAT